MGARRCFGDQDDDCCNFYDPANGQCLIQCPFDRMVTDTFDCAGVYIEDKLTSANNALALMYMYVPTSVSAFT